MSSSLEPVGLEFKAFGQCWASFILDCAPGKVSSLAGMFTRVLDPPPGKFQMFSCSHHINENECAFQQIREALRKTRLNILPFQLVFLWTQLEILWWIWATWTLTFNEISNLWLYWTFFNDLYLPLRFYFKGFHSANEGPPGLNMVENMKILRLSSLLQHSLQLAGATW